MALSDQFRQSLVDLRNKNGWTQEDMARKLGITLSGYQRIEYKGTTTQANLEKLAEIFGVPVTRLLTGEPTQTAPTLSRRRRDVFQIPVVNDIPAGGFTRSFEDMIAEDYVYTTIRRPGLFALTVKGDSMSPRIENGDLVVLEPVSDFLDNQIYAVIANDSEATLKTVQRADGGYALIPTNPAYKTLFVPESKLIRLYKVVQVIRTI